MIDLGTHQGRAGACQTRDFVKLNHVILDRGARLAVRLVHVSRRHRTLMKRYAVEWRAIAWTLAFIAGFVDVQGFLTFGGYFVSFMSGNSTRLGVAAVGSTESAARLAGIIAAFVTGAAMGALCASFGARWRQSATLWFATVMLIASTWIQHLGHTYGGVCFLAVATGAVNGVFTDGGEVTVGVTYMTGTLVKLGQRLGAALRGEPLREALPYFLHWCGLVLGGIAGTLAYRRHLENALWISIALTATVAGVVLSLTWNRAD